MNSRKKIKQADFVLQNINVLADLEFVYSQLVPELKSRRLASRMY